MSNNTPKIGGRYNWKNQPERLIYLGLCEPRNGRWHQFAKVESPTVVWCEVLDGDLHMIEETKAGQPKGADTLTAGSKAGGPDGWPLAAWREMATAPLDNTMVRLLVKFDERGLDDTDEPTPTIGACNDGEWHFVGWDWYRDEFTRGSGDLLGWLPMLDTTLAAPEGAGTSEPCRPWCRQASNNYAACKVCRGGAPEGAGTSEPWTRSDWAGYADSTNAAPPAVAPEPAPDEKMAVEFYRLNPSAALFDLRRRIDGAAPPAVVGARPEGAA